MADDHQSNEKGIKPQQTTTTSAIIQTDITSTVQPKVQTTTTRNRNNSSSYKSTSHSSSSKISSTTMQQQQQPRLSLGFNPLSPSIPGISTPAEGIINNQPFASSHETNYRPTNPVPSNIMKREATGPPGEITEIPQTSNAQQEQTLDLSPTSNTETNNTVNEPEPKKQRTELPFPIVPVPFYESASSVASNYLSTRSPLDGKILAKKRNHLCQMLYEQSLDGNCPYTNVKVMLKDGEVMRCHDCVLSASSEYFRAQLEDKDKWRESSSKTIDLKQHDTHSIRMMVKYLYGQQISIGVDNCHHLWTTADYFQIDQLKAVCESRLMTLLTNQSCLKYYYFAKNNDLPRLKEFAWDHAMKNARSISKTNEFKRLCTEQLIEFLSDDGLHVDREESVFMMLETWVDFAAVERRDELERIIGSGSVRLGLVSGQFLLEEVDNFFEKHDQSSWSNKIIKTATKYQLLSNEKKSQSSTWNFNNLDARMFRTRISNGLVPTLVIVGGINESSRITSVRALQKLPSSGRHEEYKWWNLKDIDTEHRNAHSYFVNVLDNNIYITGGHHSSGSTMKNVSMFNPLLCKWAKIADLKMARERHAGTTLEDDLYVAGGLLTSIKNNPRQPRETQRERPTVLNTIERYAPKAHGDKWEIVTEIPNKCYSPGMAGHKMKLYIVGGVGLAEPGVGVRGSNAGIRKMVLSEVQIYDTRCEQWSTVQLQTPLARLSCAINQDKIYMLANNDKQIYRYNMTTNALSEFTQMPKVDNFNDQNGLEFASFTVFDNKLAICGGQVQPNIMTSQVNFLSITNGKPVKKTNLQRPICMHGAVTIMHRRNEFPSRIYNKLKMDEDSDDDEGETEEKLSTDKEEDETFETENTEEEEEENLDTTQEFSDEDETMDSSGSRHNSREAKASVVRPPRGRK